MDQDPLAYVLSDKPDPDNEDIVNLLLEGGGDVDAIVEYV